MQKNALAIYGKVLDIDPCDLAALQNQGRLLLAKGDAAEAIASFDRVLALDPNLADAKYYLALAALRQGKPGVARERYRNFLAHPGGTPALREQAERELASMQGSAPAGGERTGE